MRKTFLKVLSLSLLLPALAAAEPVTYKVDADHSGVGFSIRHFVSNVSGRFRDFDGVVKYDKANPAASSVEFTVKAASIDTANNDRDEHLRSKDFFDVQKFPTLTFTSTKVVAKDANTLDVTGNLTMHGVTKPISMDVVYNKAGKHLSGKYSIDGFTATGKIKRSDFDMKAFIPWIGDEMEFIIQFEAHRPNDPS